MGLPVRLRAIERMIRHGSQARFGKTIGPHRVRHSPATSCLNNDPSNPTKDAAVLTNFPAVAEPHYALEETLAPP